MTDQLSIAAAAAEAGDAPAIITAAGVCSFAECAARVARMPRPPLAIVAEPSIETILAIHAALEHRRPLALVHHRTPREQAADQRATAAAAAVDDAAIILFTSGSTATPRGVVLARPALHAAAEASARHLGWRDGDRWLLALSTAHAGGLAIVIRCLAARKPIVLLDRDFSAAAVASLFARASLGSLVPSQLSALLDDPTWRPPPHVRAILLGGAAAPASVLAAAAARGVPFVRTYGMTETLGQVATAPVERAGDPHAQLTPLPGFEVTAGSRAAPAAIAIRGDALATRYLDGSPIAPRFVTTDLGYLEGGTLHVIGRSDDMLISGGENVAPAVVEAVLLATPEVRAACVVGVSDPRWGEVVGAMLVVGPSFDRGAALRAWHAELPAHARPRRLAIVDGLPLLPAGKVDRQKIRRDLARGGNAIDYGP